MMDKHYKNWLDYRIPTLGDKTPRESVKTKSGRKKVEDLLRTIEYTEQGKKEKGQFAYDFSWMRKELGMEKKHTKNPDPLLHRKPIYQLKITLKEIEPLIWRRVLVSGNVSMKTVHKIIQIAMGWTNSHLHLFGFYDGRIFSDPVFELEDDPVPEDESKNKLRKVAPSIGIQFIYQYDFGDSWEHVIEVEDILPPGPSGRVPRCIDGENACPPEDVGGPHGYFDFLEAILDPKHEEHEEMLAWCGGFFNPRKFDMKEVNEALKRL